MVTENVTIRTRADSSASQMATLYLPSDVILDAPIVVILHGFGVDQGHMVQMAEAAADHGVPVLNASWLADASRPEQSVADAVCAVAFAVEHATEWGSNPGRVIVMGHSGGGHVGMLAALTPELFPDCPAASSVAVWAYLGLASDPASAAPGGNARPLWEHDADLLALMDNYTHIGANPNLVARFVHGTADSLVPIERTTAFHEELIAAGYDSVLIPIPEAGHSDPAIPDSTAGSAALDELTKLILLATS